MRGESGRGELGRKRSGGEWEGWGSQGPGGVRVS